MENVEKERQEWQAYCAAKRAEVTAKLKAMLVVKP